MIVSFIKNSNCIDSKWMSFCIGAVFTEKRFGTYISYKLIVRLKPTWIWYDLLTVSHSGHRTTSFLTLFNLWWCYCVIEYRNNERKSKQHVGLYLKWMKHLLKYFFWINEANIYRKTWRSRHSQLHRLTRLNTSTRSHVSWRQIWYICLTVLIFWICLRFRNVEVKYLRKISICIPKYNA